ncbi:MAG: tetratricopeptide repeat protein [Verrucomicrobiae bacterium]|nr:tetratricopeptide repeat protein [Verrucomicrobiae bacterium]
MRCCWWWACLFLVFAVPAEAADSGRVAQATVVALSGQVQFQPAGTATWYTAATNQVLYGGDMLRTGPRSRATLQLRDRSIMPVREMSMLRFADRPQGTLLQILRGIISFFHQGQAGQVTIEGGGVSAVVRGTEFAFEVREAGGMRLTLFDGEVDLTDAEGRSLSIGSGDVAEAGDGMAPRRLARIEAGDWSAVQWALYYPAILDPADLGWGEAGVPVPELAAAWAAYRRGNLPQAMAGYPADRWPERPDEKVFLAALLLAVGSVEEAESVLEGMEPEDEDDPWGRLAVAHRRLIDTVRRGSTDGPDHETPLATELLAASYARQAGARLAAARDLARAATDVSPDFGLAWVRLAELEFVLGNTRAAEQALERGLALVPEHAEAHTLRGFLAAARHRVREAEAAFEEALRLDPALGNAWLGRGLVRIRRGELEAGREDLQAAAALEPQRAALRSYLGKALSDSRAFRTPALAGRAEHELDRARELDPGDPTPWLYSALMRQRENRVNEAVADLERSLDLNDNRAVYRSRLGLDQDRSVRGANLAALYRDAGLEAYGERAATRAVEDDYLSFSAHQFLADSYNARRDANQVDLRYETAWFSEFLVANLLAPVGAGRLSTTLAPNEYSRLFERDGPGLAGRTDYWSNGDWQQTGSQFGTFGSFGYALDVMYRSANGQRINDDAEQLTLSLQAKQQVGARDGAFLQLIYSDAEFGDVAPYYDPADANPRLRATDRQEPQVLVGWHRAWAPGSDTLLLVSRLHDRYTMDDPLATSSVLFRNPDGSPFRQVTVPTPLRYENEFVTWSFEGQHIWQHEAHTVIVGLRQQTGSFETRTELGPGNAAGVPVPGLSQDLEADLLRFTAYGYEHWQVLDWLRLSAGLSYDRLRQPVNYRIAPVIEGEETLDRVSPKAGVTVTPWRDGVLRGAYTRSLGGVSFDQSFRLEPTQIAGFNQAYRGLIPEAAAGSVAGQAFETWGVSFEQRFPTRTYLTVGWERLESRADRNLGVRELPFGAAPTVGTLRQGLRYDEDSVTVTVHQLLGRDVSVGAGYRMSEATLVDALPAFPGSGREVESLLHQVRIEGRYTHPTGFFALAEGVWTQQSNRGYSPDRPGDDFWHVNLHAGWRFDRRNVEIRAGVLNLTDQDYRLNPLNSYREPYRDRTFTTSLRFDF